MILTVRSTTCAALAAVCLSAAGVQSVSDPATQRPSDPATQRPSDPATRQRIEQPARIELAGSPADCDFDICGLIQFLNGGEWACATADPEDVPILIDRLLRPNLNRGLSSLTTTETLFLEQWCRADVFADGILNVNDSVTFANAYSAGESIADLAYPLGTLDVNDIIEFSNSFNSGCINPREVTAEEFWTAAGLAFDPAGFAISYDADAPSPAPLSLDGVLGLAPVGSIEVLAEVRSDAPLPPVNLADSVVTMSVAPRYKTIVGRVSIGSYVKDVLFSAVELDAEVIEGTTSSFVAPTILVPQIDVTGLDAQEAASFYAADNDFGMELYYANITNFVQSFASREGSGGATEVAACMEAARLRYQAALLLIDAAFKNDLTNCLLLAAGGCAGGGATGVVIGAQVCKCLSGPLIPLCVAASGSLGCILGGSATLVICVTNATRSVAAARAAALLVFQAELLECTGGLLESVGCP